MQQLDPNLQMYLRSGVAITSFQQCVDELVLNSIDAEATCIAVRTDLSCGKVQVIDNGHGMVQKDLSIVADRYTTSKCHELSDLDKLQQFGFRGEALASIRDICFLLEIESRSKSSTQTYVNVFQNGKPLDMQKAKIQRPSPGTTITIYDLFHKIPVRKKCLNEALEFERVKERLEAISLIHPHISISLRNDASGQKVLQTHKANSILGAFTHLYGVSKARHLCQVSQNLPPFTLSGYISKEGVSSKNYQFLYVNNRLVLKTKMHKVINFHLSRSSLLRRKGAWENAGSGNGKVWVALEPGSPQKQNEKHAVYILNVKCDLSEYDITFDPAKTLVEFKNWSVLAKCLYSLVRTFLEKENFVTAKYEECEPNIDFNETVSKNGQETEVSCNDFEGNDKMEKKNAIYESKNLLQSETVIRPEFRGLEEENLPIHCCSEEDSVTPQQIQSQNDNSIEHSGIDTLDINPFLVSAKYDRNLGSEETSSDHSVEKHLLESRTEKAVSVILDNDKCERKTTEIAKSVNSSYVTPFNPIPTPSLTNLFWSTACDDSERIPGTRDKTFVSQSQELIPSLSIENDKDTQKSSRSKQEENVEEFSSGISKFKAAMKRLHCTEKNTTQKESPWKKIKQHFTDRLNQNPNYFTNDDCHFTSSLQEFKKHSNINQHKNSSINQFLKHSEEESPLCLSNGSQDKRRFATSNNIVNRPTAAAAKNMFNHCKETKSHNTLEGKALNVAQDVIRNSVDILSKEKQDFSQTGSETHIDLKSTKPEQKMCIQRQNISQIPFKKPKPNTVIRTQLYQLQETVTATQASNVSTKVGNEGSEKFTSNVHSDFTINYKSTYESDQEKYKCFNALKLFQTPSTKTSFNSYESVHQNAVFPRKRHIDESKNETLAKKLSRLSMQACRPPNLEDATLRNNKEEYFQTNVSRNIETNDIQKEKDDYLNEKEIEAVFQDDPNVPSERPFYKLDKYSYSSLNSTNKSSKSPNMEAFYTLDPANSIDNNEDCDNYEYQKCDKSSDIVSIQKLSDYLRNGKYKSCINENKQDVNEKQSCHLKGLQGPASFVDECDNCLQDNGKNFTSSVSEHKAHEFFNTQPIMFTQQFDTYGNSTQPFKVSTWTPDVESCSLHEIRKPCEKMEPDPVHETQEFSVSSESSKPSLKEDTSVHDYKEQSIDKSNATLGNEMIMVNRIQQCGINAHKPIMNSYENECVNKMADIDDRQYDPKASRKSVLSEFVQNTANDENVNSKQNDKIEDTVSDLDGKVNNKSLRNEQSNDNFATQKKMKKLGCKLITETRCEEVRTPPRPGQTEASDDWIEKVDSLTGQTIFINKVNGNSSYAPPTSKEESQVELKKVPEYILPDSATEFMNTKLTSTCSSIQTSSSGVEVISSMLNAHLNRSVDDENKTVKWRDPSPGIAGEKSNVASLLDEWENPAFQVPEKLALNVEGKQAPRAASIIHKLIHPHQFTVDIFTRLQVIGQIDNKFISCIAHPSENQPSLLIVIDQHAAHERVRLEKLIKAAYQNETDRVLKRVKVDPPVKITLSEDEVRIMNAYAHYFERIGVAFKSIENDRAALMITTIPACLAESSKSLKKNAPTIKIDVVETLLKDQIEMVEKTHGGDATLPRALHNLLCSQACHGAIKFGDALEVHECKELISELALCRLPFQCAHGRPSIMPLLDLNMFKTTYSKQITSYPQLNKLKNNLAMVGK